MELLCTERREGVLIVQFQISELAGEDLISRVGCELSKQADEAKAYGGKLLLNFQGVRSMSSAMLGKLVLLNKRCRDLRVKLKMCSIPPDFLTMFPGGNPNS